MGHLDLGIQSCTDCLSKRGSTELLRASEIFALAARLYPICRSVAGEGVRETSRLLSQHIPLEIREVPTGTRVFDWTVPSEWDIRDAFIKNGAGERVVDFRTSNLHVVNYSTPVHARMRLADLKKHIFTLPSQPDLVPYRTSYYAESWGFCMAHNQLMALPDGMYEVMIDFSLERRSTELRRVPAQRRDGRRGPALRAHLPSVARQRQLLGAGAAGLSCEPALADEDAATATASSSRPAPSVRSPGCRSNESTVSPHQERLVVVMRRRRRRPDLQEEPRAAMPLIDRAMAHVLRHASPAPNIIDFFPYGYDERQYCSPGFDLPVGLFQRSQFGDLPGVPYVGRQSRLHQARASVPASYAHDHGRPRHRRKRLHDAQSVSARASRSSAGAGSTARSAATTEAAGQEHGAALGAEPVRRQAFAARYRRACQHALRDHLATLPTLLEAEHAHRPRRRASSGAAAPLKAPSTGSPATPDPSRRSPLAARGHSMAKRGIVVANPAGRGRACRTPR